MKVLCAVDGSEFSNRAIEAVGTLFHQSLKELRLIHVMDDLHLKQGLKKEGVKAMNMKKILVALEDDAKKILESSKQKAALAISQSTTKPFISIKSFLGHGHVTETIINEAQRRKTDIIVMGSRGLSDIKGYLMGSVSRKVLVHAPCSVLTVKDPIPKLCRSLLAVDGSNASKRAATFLKNYIRPSTLSLHVLSVVPNFLTDIAPKVLSKSHLKALTQPFQIRAKELTVQYREFFLKEGYEITTEVQSGDPKKVILNSLEKKKRHLAIMGTKGLTRPERFQMGSVSEWVAAYTASSVLVVRPRLG